MPDSATPRSTSGTQPPVQTPAVQTSRAVQLIPHPPQLLTSLSKLTQASAPHGRSPPEHVRAVIPQTPSTHKEPMTHRFVQPPQAMPLALGSTQWPLQHNADPGHVRPQAPQFAGPGVVQTAPQTSCPPVHVARQLPATQVLPLTHATWQAPQFRLSVWVSASQPLLAFESQSPKPVRHAIPHTKVPAALHVGIACVAGGHGEHDVPQLDTLELLTHALPHG